MKTSDLTVTITSNLGELIDLLDDAADKADELRKAIDEVNNFKINIDFVRRATECK